MRSRGGKNALRRTADIRLTLAFTFPSHVTKIETWSGSASSSNNTQSSLLLFCPFNEVAGWRRPSTMDVKKHSAFVITPMDDKKSFCPTVNRAKSRSWEAENAAAVCCSTTDTARGKHFQFARLMTSAADVKKWKRSFNKVSHDTKCGPTKFIDAVRTAWIRFCVAWDEVIRSQSSESICVSKGVIFETLL